MRHIKHLAQCLATSFVAAVNTVIIRAWQMSSYLFGHACWCPHTCLETYEVLVFMQMTLSSLQQPPHRNTFTQGGLKNLLVVLPSSLATSTHVSLGLHWVLCHSSSITAERKLIRASRRNSPDMSTWARVMLDTVVFTFAVLVYFTRWIFFVGPFTKDS